MIETFSSEKINGTKNTLFILLQAPTHHSFTFNLRFLYELKHKNRLSKTVCGNLHSVLILLKSIFLFNEMYGLLDFKMS